MFIHSKQVRYDQKGNTKPFSDADCSHTCLAYCLAFVKKFGV